MTRRARMSPSREIVVKRTNERWWDYPWQAWLEVNGEWVTHTFCVAMTRRGVLHQVRRRIYEYDHPKPPWEEVERERIPA